MRVFWSYKSRRAVCNAVCVMTDGSYPCDTVGQLFKTAISFSFSFIINRGDYHHQYGN